eukprot:TRINITY_DN2764_c0_g1_i1.p1 TRINITY_DN2764_c0_g1~~TRINITY_DN2764_c0_g1_i1.p1  ORF type:complete len:188 (+),score=51.16 TRINITY_DN2764_c0_g1_i1:216-779(+)
MAGADIMENINTNTLFLIQCVIAAVIGGLEFCFPALFVDTFNTFEVYTSHRLYGATMIVNAIVVYTMRETNDHKIKREIVQAFLFQFGLHIIVLLRPQVWGFLTPFNKVNLLCSFGLAATYGYLLMGESRKPSSGFKIADKLKSSQINLDKTTKELSSEKSKVKNMQAQIDRLEAELSETRRKLSSR